MKSYRQGDVLIIEACPVPEGAERVQAEGRYVLAEGEATGHAHAIAVQPDVEVRVLGESLFIKAGVPVEVVHEEHDTITLPPGEWKVVRQVEYTPAALKRVMD